LKPQKEITSITLKTGIDYDYPVDAVIGSFDRDSKSDLSINHWRRGGNPHDTCEWFNPANTETKADAERDYLLVMEICNNRKFFTRVQVTAKINIKVGGLWLNSNVASDLYDGILNNDHEGIEEAKKDATSDATNLLLEAGFSQAQINAAMKKMEEEEWGG